MPKSGKHLTFENREVVEQGIKDGDSASRIARRLRVAASTVTREAKAHRTVRPKKLKPGDKAPLRCAKRAECSKSGTACPKCSYRVSEAQAAYEAALSQARSGACSSASAPSRRPS